MYIISLILHTYCLWYAIGQESSPTHRRNNIQLKNGPTKRRRGLVDNSKSPIGEPRHVVIVLKDDSVSQVRASLKRKTNRGETDAIVKNLKRNQAGLVNAVEMYGGTVIQQYQHAINGIRVHISEENEDTLRHLQDVVDILPVRKFQRMNVKSVPYLGVPKVWNGVPLGLGIHGEGIKVGIIDTGIDYTHANFGGPGTVEAFVTASATSDQIANASLFGPNAPKVKGGYDFAGDSYDGYNDPIPDANPLDCEGHGSHVAGTVGGYGVKLDGTTYTGSYNDTIYAPNSFLIGPGAAPKVDIYVYRVFGCTGASDLVVDAIDRAIADDVDVINMSLGSDFGADNILFADSVASNNAIRSGVIVVASAGNSGPIPYISGAPASADGAISVAAMDNYASYPGASITTFDGNAISVLNENDKSFLDGTAYTVIKLTDDPSTPYRDESRGCNIWDYPSPMPPFTLIAVKKGTCYRPEKALTAQQAGAAAVIIINTDPSYPPFDGSIPGLNILLLGAKSSDDPVLEQYNGTLVTLQNSEPIQNPFYRRITSFSSGGPRNGDSFLKPDISAPGASITSTAMGTGYQGVTYSGTSMSSPHVAGVAALVRQAHPTWSVVEIKAAIMSTANPTGLDDFNPRLAGSGLVDPFAATRTSVWAAGLAPNGHLGSVAVNFGFVELTAKHYSAQKSLIICNRGNKTVSFSVRVGNTNGVPHTLSTNSALIKVGPFKNATLGLTLQVPVATAGNSNGFVDASGTIQLTPLGSGNNGIELRVPYYIVPRSISSLSASIKKIASSVSSYNVSVTNTGGPIPCHSADFYVWGIHCDEPSKSTFTSIRAVGVKSITTSSIGDETDPLILFAINTYRRWSSPSTAAFYIYIDVDPQNMNGDDYIVYGYDYGAIEQGAFSGIYGTFVFSFRSFRIDTLDPGNTYASTDSSLVILPILSSFLCREDEPCLSPDNPRFTYTVESVDYLDNNQVCEGVASFNPYSPAVTFHDSQLGSIASGKSDSNVIQIDQAEWDMTPALGVLVVAADNKAGKDQAIELLLPSSNKVTKMPNGKAKGKGSKKGGKR